MSRKHLMFALVFVFVIGAGVRGAVYVRDMLFPPEQHCVTSITTGQKACFPTFPEALNYATGYQLNLPPDTPSEIALRAFNDLQATQGFTPPMIESTPAQQ